MDSTGTPLSEVPSALVDYASGVATVVGENAVRVLIFLFVFLGVGLAVVGAGFVFALVVVLLPALLAGVALEAARRLGDVSLPLP
jgi:hypothetical protein